MIIIHKIDDFLFNLFPKAKETEKSVDILKDELGNYYTFGPSPSGGEVSGVFPTLGKGGKGGFEQFKPSPPAGEGKGEGELNLKAEPAAQMAVTMYCLSALQYFADKDLEEIKKVGFEIAVLGRQGIDPSKTEKKYNLESIPGKEFSGLQLLAYMYSAFQVIDPFLNTGMKFKKEYEAARVIFEKREENE